MASKQVKSERRAKALERLSSALGIKEVDLHANAEGDPGLALVITLERAASAAEKVKPGVPGDALRAAILAASDEELTAIPGIGDKSLDQVREWAKTPPEQPPVVVETVKAEPLKTTEVVEVVESKGKK